VTTDAARVCANCGTENPAEARFCFNCAAPLEAVAPPAESRKTVTVLFCDLVGSTALGEQLDPETLRGMLNRSFDRVSAIVERHGGVVEKFIGDAAMAVFGIPRVHEDDALRAVRAAAEIRDALGENGDARLAWRTGIATGEVVAGDSTAGQRLVTGDPVNVAARLQQAAQPGEILITAETQRLVRDAVEVESLGDVAAKGRTVPIETFRLLAVDRSAAGHERRLDSPMVGRERPRRLLDDAFAEARDERICHLFTILGTAGVGKSRLVNEFIGSLSDEVRVVRGRCLSYGEGITYWPIGEIVRSAIANETAAPDSVDELGRIRFVVADHDDADRITDIVGQTLGLSRGEAPADEIPWAIRSFLEELARGRPLVVVLDDLQWAEPPLLDLVEHIADWSHDAPILLIAMARRELLDVRPAWGGGKRSATVLSLEPLNAEETSQLIENLLGRAELPATVFDRIRIAAEGNPFFVEELLEMLIDDGALERSNGNWTARRDLTALSVPPTIQALLAARLDGLAGSDRAVLERGAVEGTLFHRDAVSALAPDSLREAVGPSLMSLTRREFVTPDRAELAGREAFRFRHQLIRDAAYQAIAKQSRAELHERFAAWLDQALADRLDEFAPILAYHLEQAARYRRELDPDDPALTDLERRAVDVLVRAGEAALDRGDVIAAANLLGRAIDLLGPDEQSALPIRLAAGEAMVRAVPAAESRAFLVETRSIAERLGDPRSASLAEVIGMHLRSSMGEEITDSVREASRLYEEVQSFGEPGGTARAGLELAKMRFWAGQAQDAYELSRELASLELPTRMHEDIVSWVSAFAYWGPIRTEEVLELVDRQIAEGGTSRFLAVRASRHRGGVLAQLGRHEESAEEFRRAAAWGETLGDKPMLGSLGGHFWGPSELLAGHAERAVELGQESVDLLLAIGYPGFANTAAAHLARALLALGRNEEAEKWAREAVEMGSADDPGAVGAARGAGARAVARLGRLDEGLEMGQRAIAAFEGADYLDQMADAHFDYAEVLELAGRPDEAIAQLRTALDLYERKGHVVGSDATRRRLAEMGAGSGT
jgi:class 3 adenylate cyclase/tetratricopeptide (TPR) repeat protein